MLSCTMKRKLSNDSRHAFLPVRKKKLPDNTVDVQTQPCQLLQILAQYGLLAAIATNLFPKDLYALAATSKAAYRAIFTCHKSHANLLGKMACDGRGYNLRQEYHDRSQDQHSCNTLAWPFRCETSAPGAPTRPCSECNHMTCDECRIHCVFQATYKEPDADDEVPTMTGYALLSRHEMGILTPFAMGLDNRAQLEQQMAVGRTDPYHDMGYLEASLTSDTYANPESIEEIINFELGRNSLRLSGNSATPHPSSTVRPFWEITEDRKWSICRECVYEWRKIADDTHCRCTLKKHFLDRWLCLPCYQKEIEQLREVVTPSAPSKGTSACNNCGDRVLTDSLRTMCVWCLGESLALWSLPDP